jgi:hypothetical protein
VKPPFSSHLQPNHPQNFSPDLALDKGTDVEKIDQKIATQFKPESCLKAALAEET